MILVLDMSVTESDMEGNFHLSGLVTREHRGRTQIQMEAGGYTVELIENVDYNEVQGVRQASAGTKHSGEHKDRKQP